MSRQAPSASGTNAVQEDKRDGLTYNGLPIPSVWPPQDISPGGAPLPVPYLAAPPRVIPIDVGRQLFVDDFLIEYTTLTRTYHQAQVHDAAPVLSPQTELERNGGRCPVAAPFNDGAWYDPQDNLFKLWYHAGWFDGTALAVSDDGLHWRRPPLDVVSGTNAVIAPRPGHRRDGGLVWRDADAEPDARFKMFLFWRWAQGQSGAIYRSADGIHWQELGLTSPCGDNTSFFYNPFRRAFVFSIRAGWHRRARSYFEHADFARAARWPRGAPAPWARADRLDRPDPFLGAAPQLYDANAVAYESLMLGVFALFQGPDNQTAAQLGRPKINDLHLAYSRDGFHWHRPCRTPFLPCSRRWGDWNYGYHHAAGGVCLVVRDELRFYYGAFSGHGSRLAPGATGAFPQDNAMYAGGHTGLATLRRDGFASLEADRNGGCVATRPVSFTGRYLFVNLEAPDGELRVEILNEAGAVLEPYSLGNCRPVRADSTRAPVQWRGVPDLAPLARRPVQFRFHLRAGKLYAFWVSPAPTGVSRGFLAAGGPGYAEPRDV